MTGDSREPEVKRTISRRRFLGNAAAAGVSFSTLGALAAACGGESGSAEPAQSAPAASSTTAASPSATSATPAAEIEGDLTSLNAPYALPDEEKLWQRYDANFTQTHPKITVKQTWFDWATVDTDLATAFAKSNPPDIVYLPGASRTQLAWAGALLDLTGDVQGDPSYADAFSLTPDWAWEGGTYDGKILQVPSLGSANAHAVNVSLMKEAGVTDWSSSWDAMLEATRAVRSLGSKTYGFASHETYASYSHFIWLPLLWSAGGDLYTADATAGALDTPDTAAAFDLLGSLYVDSGPKPGLYDFNGMKAVWGAGRLGIFAHAGAGASGASLFPDPLDFEWDIMLWPAGPNGTSTSLAAVDYLAASAATEHPEASWEYLKYLSADPQFLLDWLPNFAGAGIAARADVNADVLEAVATNEVVRKQREKWPQSYSQHVDSLLAKQADWFDRFGKTLPNYPSTNAVFEAVSKEVELLLRGEKTGEQAAADANEQINRAIAAA